MLKTQKMSFGRPHCGTPSDHLNGFERPLRGSEGMKVQGEEQRKERKREG